jgi:hypothetical protein
MATRPVVLVFQEFATLSSSPAEPSLNCCVTGPAYWIQDFPEDRASIKLSVAYGVKNDIATASAPVDGTDAITIADAPNNKIGAVLDAASVRVFFGSPRVAISTGTDGISASNSASYSSTTVNFTTAGVKAGDYAILTNGSAATIVRRVRTVSGTTLTFTDEIARSGYVNFRIERELSDTEIESDFIEVTSGTNEIIVKGGVTLPVNGVDKVVTYADVYVAYRSLRQDLQDVKTISSVTAITGQLGRIDARNPLAAGVFIALQNTNASIQYFGIASDDLAGFNAMKSSISGRKDIYAVVPLTQDIDVIASFKNEFEALASPDYALENGVPQKFRVVIGSAGVLPDTKIVVDRNTDGQTQTTSGATVSGAHTVTFATGVNLITLGILPGYSFDVDDDTFTVAHVNSATSLEIVEAGSAGTVSSAVVQFKNASGTNVGSAATTNVTTAVDDTLFLDFYDANATFIDDGVIPGDLLETPKDPTRTTFNVRDRFTVATIVSNQRLRIRNNGRNTALVTNELPHGVTRVATVALVPTSATLPYRVLRTLDKDGQVDELVALPVSVKSRRAILCWPDTVDVAGLVDGSLTRSTAAPSTPVAADSQPGYYLACAVGGMTTALPSHQGFTNLGIAGIHKLYNSNTYFEDKQITDLSNGGWFVFQQDTPQALPYIVHQLTTDPSTLQFGEFSLVKNFDYVSMYFSDILDDFIGPWNINKETIGFIQAAVQAGIDNLKLRKLPRIGAPVIDAHISSIGESTVSEDRLELFVEADFPKPLNTVGLHIVSV